MYSMIASKPFKLPRCWWLSHQFSWLYVTMSGSILGREKNPAQTGRSQPHAALAIQVMIESAWNFSYFIVILWLFNVANWKIIMFNSKIIMLIIYKWTMFIHFLLCSITIRTKV